MRLTRRKHHPPTPFLCHHIQWQIAQSIRDVEQQNQKTILLSPEPEIRVHTVCLRIAEIRPVDCVEEVHDGQEGEEVEVEFAD